MLTESGISDLENAGPDISNAGPTAIRLTTLSSAEIKRLIVFGILFAAMVFLAIRFIAAIGGVVLLFSLVALFTLILSPLVTWLERHKVPRYVGTIALAVFLLGLIAVVAWQAYPILRDQLGELFASLPRYVSRIEGWLAEHVGFMGFERAKAPGQRNIGIISRSSNYLLARVGSYTLSAIELLASMGIVFISTIYALARPRQLIEGLLRLIEPDRSERAANILQNLAGQLRKWAYSLLVGMLAVALLTWIALGPVLHLPFSLLFAAIAGLLEVVPTIGPILSAVLPAIIALGISPMLFVWVLIAFTIIQQIENHIIVPIVLGRGVQLHPVSVIFAVAVLGAVFGIVGVFLAVPAAVTVKILVEELYIKPRELHKEQLGDKVEPIVSGQEHSRDDGSSEQAPP